MNAKDRAEAHWNGYVGPMMEAMLNVMVKGMMDMSRFHYISSHIHGSKHGIEDERERAEEEAFFEEVVDHVALEAELDRSCGDAAADAAHANRTKDLFTRGCPTCLDAAACAKAMTTDTRGKCLFHRLSLRENMLDAKQEAAMALPSKHPLDCLTSACEHHALTSLRNCGKYPASAVSMCNNYEPLDPFTPTAKQEAPTAAVLPLDFTLPSIALKCTAEEAAEKFWSEREEWKAAKEGSLHELVERWDCLQALYTFAERGGDVEWYQNHARVVMEDLARYHADGGDVAWAKRQMLRKNADRGYYSPVVNEAILSTCGHRFTPVLGGPA